MFAYDELMRGYLPYNGEKARHYGCKALALSYQLNELLIRQYTLRNFGLLSYGRQDYDKALDYFNQALAVTDTIMQSRRYTQKDLDDSRSALYGSIANVYNMQGKAHLAISYYQRALPIFERNNWLESQAILYNNIGELYLTMGNEVEAERNYLLAVQKGEASKDSLMVALPRKGLLRIYIDKSDYTKARQTAEQCYGYYHAHRTEETEDYPVVLALLVRLNLMEGHRDMTTAKAYAEEALNLVDSLMFENQSEVYTACCEIAMVERQWQKALGYALRSIHSDSLAMNTDVANYQLLAEIYTELGHKEKAREYIRKMYDVMTRYATDHYQSGLSQMEVLYETEKKEVRIAVLDKERSLYRWLLVAAAIAIVALVAGSFLMMAVHRREKALLAAKVALETETNERRIMARDLHDGLGGMLSLLRLKMEDYKRQMGQQGQQEEVLPLLDNIHTELRRTAHHLMPEELLKNGLLSALRDFAVSVPNARFQTVGNIHLAKETSLVLYRCAYELVNNALKHAEAGLIDIQLIQEPHAATLTVCDNGKGITTAAEGMGLQNIRERIAPYHGKMDIISDANGTEINVTLPL